MTDKSVIDTILQSQAHPDKIPDAVRAMLAERKRWHDTLALLEKLEAGNRRVSEGHIQIEWDVFKTQLTTNCDSAAVLLISTMSCICWFRPEMFEKLIDDACNPLTCLGLSQLNMILKWCAAREDLDPAVKAWIVGVLTKQLAEEKAVAEKPAAVDGAVRNLLGLPSEMHVAVPKTLHLSNYNVVWANSLYALLLALPCMGLFWLSGSFLVALFGAPFLLLGLVLLYGNRDDAVTVDLNDGITVRRFLSHNLHYGLDGIQHIYLREMHTKLDFIIPVTKHTFADIYFTDRESTSIRLTKRETKALYLLLKDRGFGACMDEKTTRKGTVPIVALGIGLGGD